jgi:hypothetical protein
MPKNEYTVVLSDEEKEKAHKIVKTGKNPARLILRTRILLLTDDNREPSLTIREVADICNVSTTTVMAVREKYSTSGFEATINRKKRQVPPVEPKITGDVEAKIIALSCSAPPEGYSKWTVRLLADKAVELKIIDSIHYSSVSNLLKKTK